MILEFDNIIDKNILTRVMDILNNSNTKWNDGKLTAGGYAKLIKESSELNENDMINGVRLTDMVIGVRDGMILNPKFKDKYILGVPGCRPMTGFIAKYGVGEHYDWHVDNINSKGYGVADRATHAISLVLNDDFEGGELEIKDPMGNITKHNPKNGSAVLFSTNHLHRVLPVTKGVRYSLITWVQHRLNQSQWEIVKLMRDMQDVIHEQFDTRKYKTEDEVIKIYGEEKYKWFRDLTHNLAQLKSCILNEFLN